MKHKSYRALALGLAAAQFVPLSGYSVFAETIETPETPPKTETAAAANEAAVTAENDQVKDMVLVKAPTIAPVKENYTDAPAAQAILITSYYSGKVTITKVELTGTGASDFTLTDHAAVELTSTANDTNAWTIQPKTGLSKGTHTATIKASFTVGDDGTVQTTTADVTFVVAAADAKDLKDATVTLTGADGLVYDGTAKTPSVTVEFSGATEQPVPDTDYTVEYADNTNAGEATVTVTAKSENYTGSQEVKFSIAKKQLEAPAAPTAQDANITSDSITLDALTAVKGAEAKYSKDNGTTWQTSPEFTGLDPKTEYSFVAMYEATDTTNLISSEKSAVGKVTTKEAEKTSLATATVTVEDGVYNGGAAVTPKVTVELGGKTLAEGTDYELSWEDNTDVGTNSATVTVNGIGDYTGSTQQVFSILKADQSKPTGLKMLECTDTTITLTADASPNGTTLEYAMVESGVVGAWQTEAKFDSLTPGTEYQFVARYKGNGNYEASLQCNPVTVSTAKAEYALTVEPVDFGAVNVDYPEFDYVPIVIRATGNKDVIIKSINMPSSPGFYTKFQIKDSSDKTVSVSEPNNTFGIRPEHGIQKGDYTETITVTYYLGETTDSPTATAVANVTFEVLAADVKALNEKTTTISVDTTDCKYTGDPITPTITVTYNDGTTKTTLTKDTDYAVEYAYNTDAGTATVKVTGNGTTYGGTVSQEFTIEKADQTAPAALTVKKKTDTTIELEYAADNAEGYGALYSIDKATWQENPVFTGLEPEKEYTIYAKYPEDKNHYESSTKSIKVTTEAAPAHKITDADVSLEEAEYVYDKTEKKPAVTVKDGEKVLTEGTDYSVEYSDNIAAGTAKVTVTGKGKYTGTVEKTFTIKAADQTLEGELTAAEITKDTIKLSAIPDNAETKAKAEYKLGENGTWQASPEFTGLEPETEYTIYARYAAVLPNYNASNAISKTFTTANAEGKLSIANATVTVKDADSIVYTGKAITPEIEVKLGSETLVKDTDYTAEYKDNTNAGKATITITAKGDKYTGTTTANFTIKAAKLAAPKAPTVKEVTATSITLNPVAEVEGGAANYSIDGGKTTQSDPVFKGLKPETEYTITVLYVAIDDNHTDSDVSEGLKVTTAKEEVEPGKTDIKTATITVADADKQVYDGKAKTPAVTVTLDKKELKKDTDYTVAYTNNVNAGTATVTVTGKGDYTGTARATFTIAHAIITNDMVTVADDKLVYDGTEKKPAITVTFNGTVLKENEDYIYGYYNNVNAGTAYVWVTACDWSSSFKGNAEAAFTIAKAEQPAPAALKVHSKSATTITVDAAKDGLDDAKAEYSIDGGKTWQDDVKFTSLKSNTSYKIVARYKATDNYNASPMSEALEVKTNSASSGGSSGGGGSYRPSRPSTPSDPSPAPQTPGGENKGWNDIGADIGKSKPGSDVTVELNGSTTVPAEVLVAAANNDVKLTLKVDDTYTWEIDGANISGQVTSANFAVKSESVPAQALTMPGLVNCDSTNTISVSGVPFAYKPVLTANLGTKYVGEFANLYKVNETTGALEFVGVTKIDANGNAVIPVAENGKYVIAVDSETKMMGDFDNSMGLNALDATALLKEIVTTQTTGAYKGDVDGDGKVDVWDAVKILKMIVGLE